MKPYGMKRYEKRDVDVVGCVENGRATAVGNLPKHGGDARTYHGLRGGKKAAVRRTMKRRVRAESRALCAAGE